MSKLTITLTRIPTTDQGTFGMFAIAGGPTFFSLELPDRGNKRQESCIPKGTYQCKKINSPKHGECYQVFGVDGRDSIEIHSANFAGDVSKGFISQLLGCIALGKSIGIENGQLAVLQSKVAIAEFEAFTKMQDFTLTIK